MTKHQEKNSGWGKRDQDFGDPHRDPALDAPDGLTDDMTNRPGHDRGHVAGAHGNQPPLQDVKPGTKIELERGTP